jgi:hypothetical protein
MNILNFLTIVLIILITAVFLRNIYFATFCLIRAIKCKSEGISKYNYLKWEMPNNDIEGQVNDEIKVNILYITAFLLWILSLIFFPKSLLLIYSIYALIVSYHIKLSKGLEKRYSDFYDVFKTKTRVEDFSSELTSYGARIEGTLTKLKKTYVLAIFYCVAGIILI